MTGEEIAAGPGQGGRRARMRGTIPRSGPPVHHDSGDLAIPPGGQIVSTWRMGRLPASGRIAANGDGSRSGGIAMAESSMVGTAGWCARKPGSSAGTAPTRRATKPSYPS